MPPRLVPLALVIAALAGCGPRAVPREEVTGVVYYKGAPLQGGTIVFVPDADRGNTAPLAHGEVRADGSYSLRTGDEPGAGVGRHKVTLASADDTLPTKYGDPGRSGQGCEVKRGGPNRIDFHLE